MPTKKLLKAEYAGPLKIGDLIINASVLEDKTRVLSYRSMSNALGVSAGSGWGKGERKMPRFLTDKPLKSFIDAGLMASVFQPFEYKPLHGGRSAYGIPAELLPKICEIWLKARDARVLKTNKQKQTAEKADILMRGLAHIGIIALVDEATGYQESRDKEELQRLLEKYISKELLPWTLTFPHEFYQEMFRLKKWEYRATSKRKKPMLVGKYTKELIYDKLGPGIYGALKKKNPAKTKQGLSRYQHHRYLTRDTGHPALGKLIASVTTLMKASSGWLEFTKLYKRAFPKDFKVK